MSVTVKNVKVLVLFLCFLERERERERESNIIMMMTRRLREMGVLFFVNLGNREAFGV